MACGGLEKQGKNGLEEEDGTNGVDGQDVLKVGDGDGGDGGESPGYAGGGDDDVEVGD